jgi:hypothetical protein
MAKQARDAVGEDDLTGVLLLPVNERWHFTTVEPNVTSAQILAISLPSVSDQGSNGLPGKYPRLHARSTSVCWTRCRSIAPQPEASRMRGQTVERPFDTLKAWMGCHPLPDLDAAARQYRVESARVGMQREASGARVGVDRHYRGSRIGRSERRNHRGLNMSPEAKIDLFP